MQRMLSGMLVSPIPPGDVTLSGMYLKGDADGAAEFGSTDAKLDDDG